MATKRADSLGGVLFRNVPPGRGYRLRQRAERSGPLTVLSERPAPPDPAALYRQRIPVSGYGYLTTRDGTKLAIDVHLPSGPPPYPTLVEYSGYGYADPSGPDSGIAPVAQALGFAVVDVNMRGTGCSGGAYDYFEPLQSLDGYDVVETVAHQSWVLHHKVGMLGISFGGFSQLFVAQTDPPDLAAIAPLSDIDSSITILHPGGLLNTGFALTWIKERNHDALPASRTGGQAWAYLEILRGDRTCKANQVLHGEAVNLVAKTYANNFYVPSVADPLDPITFVHKIKAAVFLACQFTDEQTGGHCPDLAEHMTGTRHKWFTFTNGVHGDSLDPYTLDRIYDFLRLFVARQVPTPPPAVLAPILYQAAFGIGGVTLPADPIQSEPSYGAALAAFEAQPEIRILFDNGAGAQPGYPYPGFEASFSRFPVPGTRAVSWYLGPQGSLNPAKPRRRSAETFTWAPHARPATDYTGPSQAGGLWAADPRYHWAQSPAGTALAYVSAPLAHDTTVIGAGAVQAWIRASVPSVDLQVTVTEVRPDGNETFVQNGWLRTSLRALNPHQSTLLEPVLSLRRATAAPLPAGRFTEVTIPLYYEGHVYRKGSRIRIIISAPGGDQPAWAFSQLVPRGKARVWLAHSSAMPSRLVLPVVTGIRVPTALPPCPGLRGEPCRPYLKFTNQAVAP
ncbi:MAG TPA: CocE/NonD family hydrolase [Streptosporangiaceae bacterium]|nr:CocE/NonD family hydrolase [Streptosporangiaceae bacterium]